MPGPELVDVLGLREAYSSSPIETMERALRQAWATPSAFVRGLERVAGVRVALDLCAEATTAKAPVWFGPGSPHGVTDTLLDDWSWGAGLAYCNPDFARKGQWANLVLGSQVPTWFLVPPSTDQEWFSTLTNSPRAHLHILRGRLRFDPPPGIAPSAPNGPVVLWSVNFDRPLLPGSLIVKDLLELGREPWSEEGDRGAMG